MAENGKKNEKRCVLMSDLDTAFGRPSVKGLEHYEDIYLHVDNMEKYTVSIEQGTLRLYGDPLPYADSVRVCDGKDFVRSDENKPSFEDALKVIANHYAIQPKGLKEVIEKIMAVKTE